MQNRNLTAFERFGAGWIAVIYALAGLVWVSSGDFLVHSLITDTALRHIAETAKGCLYVLVTAAALYWIIRRLISRLSNANHLLNLSETSYRELFETNPLPMAIYDVRSLRFLKVNEAALQVYGFSRETFLEKTLYDIRPPERRRDLEQALRKLLENRAGLTNSGVFEHWRANGERFFAKVRACNVSYKSQVARLVVVDDVTEGIEADRALKQAVQRFEEVEKLAQIGSWEWMPGDNRLNLSNGMKRILQSAELPPGLNAGQGLDRIPGSDWDPVKAALRDIEKGKAIDITHAIRTRSGQVRHWRQRGRGLLDENGKLERFVALCVDETERMEARLRVKEQELLFETLIELLPVGVVVLRSEEILLANACALSMYGVHAADELAEFDIPADMSKAAGVESIDELAIRSQAQRENLLELSIDRHDGTPLIIEAACRPVFLQGRNWLQLVFRDVTTERRTQAELEYSNQRLVKLSSETLQLVENERKQLSRELHDDIGQLLSAIKLNARWIANAYPDETLRTKVELINGTVAEAIDKVRNLSMMLRPPQLDNLGLVEAIRWHAEQLIGSAGLDLVIEADSIDADLEPELEIAAFRLVQESLTNVIRHSEARSVRVQVRLEDNNLQLEVLDDGKGFDMANEFHSLGLVAMRERASLVGGELEVQSQPGVGTRIRGCLPIVAR